MTPGMNRFIRSGKYRGITTKVKTAATILEMTEKNLLKVAYHDYFLIFVSPSVEYSGEAVRSLSFARRGGNKSIFSPSFPVRCASFA